MSYNRILSGRDDTVSKKLSDVLFDAINDEFKARATYQLIINTFGEIWSFINIVEAEGRHIDACRLGVEAEIENAEIYDWLLDSTKDYPDVQNVLIQLQRASKENHLPAFQHV